MTNCRQKLYLIHFLASLYVTVQSAALAIPLGVITLAFLSTPSRWQNSFVDVIIACSLFATFFVAASIWIFAVLCTMWHLAFWCYERAKGFRR